MTAQLRRGLWHEVDEDKARKSRGGTEAIFVYIALPKQVTSECVLQPLFFFFFFTMSVKLFFFFFSLFLSLSLSSFRRTFSLLLPADSSLYFPSLFFLSVISFFLLYFFVLSIIFFTFFSFTTSVKLFFSFSFFYFFMFNSSSLLSRCPFLLSSWRRV